MENESHVLKQLCSHKTNLNQSLQWRRFAEHPYGAREQRERGPEATQLSGRHPQQRASRPSPEHVHAQRRPALAEHTARGLLQQPAHAKATVLVAAPYNNIYIVGTSAP